MKTFLIAFLSLVLFIPLGSCFREDFHGYPKKISIPSNGGEFTFHSDGYLYGLVIEENGKNSYGLLRVDSTSNGEVRPDSIIVQNEWLTVRAAWIGQEMTLQAKPLNGVKKRELYLSYSFGDSFADIKVIQKR